MTDEAAHAVHIPSHYHAMIRWLHWLIAGLIIFLILLGWGLTPSNPRVLSVAFWHKSTGILVLLLSLARIAIRMTYKAPPPPPMPAWQAFSAKALHALFYVAMIGMPLTGWAMASTAARDVPFYFIDWFHLPVPRTEAMHDLFESFHDAGAKILTYAMIPLHVAAALKHHLVDRDNVIEHMVPGLDPKPLLNWRWIVPVAVIAIAFGASQLAGAGSKARTPEAAVAEHAGAPDTSVTAPLAESEHAPPAVSAITSSDASVDETMRWKLLPAGTTIGWATSFQGEKIEGSFEKFTADIRFDPDRLASSKVKVRIDLRSVASGDADRDTTLKGVQFFATDQFPEATFEASRFSATGNERFVAHGKLKLHGSTVPVDMPFSLSIRGNQATLAGEAVLDRTAFGVGSGEFAATDGIPAKVKVSIRVNAVKVSPP